MSEHREGTLRIWHRNDSIKFEQFVDSIDEAKTKLKLLTDYDLALGDLIDWNAQGLEVFEEDEWVEWENGEGWNISDVMS